MFYVGCEECGRHLNEDGYSTHAEAENALQELGHQITDATSARQLVICDRCLQRHREAAV